MIQPTTTSQTSVAPAAVGPLLACGVVAGALFIVASLIHAGTRDGFDLRRHPFSFLSLGEVGWIQISIFVVSGLLFVACAVGMRRVLHPGRGGTWGPLLIGAFGASVIGGGVFLADPAFGFPPGTAEGVPENVSWHGTVHGIAFALGFLSLIAAFFVFGRRFAAAGQRGWARYSLATGVIFAALSGLGVAGGDFRIVAVAMVLGWGWVSLVAARLAMTSG